MMIGTRFSVAAVALLMAGPAFAHGGSMEDQIACTPDVYKFCTSQIPNEDAIVACLTRNKASLSPDCGKVFARPAPGQPGAAPSGDDDD